MADLSKVKIGEASYNIKDAKAREDLALEITRATGAEGTLTTNLAAEVIRAQGAEGGLDTRIKALESKGRYLSTWNAETGKPDTYPEASQLVEGKYNYRSGDYYIVNKVASSNLMPDGAYISKSGDTWTVPTKAFEGTLNLGDQFQYDGSKWTHIASATTVAFANIQGDAEENTNLKGKLDAKVPVTRKVATIDLQDDITTAELQTALGLEDLAYADTASGSYTPAGSVADIAYTPAGSITVNALTQTETAASLTKAAYTPAGSITGSAISGGSINVTVKDAASATAVTDLEYENYTPQGTISAKASGGTSAVLASATFEADANGVAITGTVSKPNVTITAGTEKTFATGLTGGKVASFTEGAFTPASISEGFFSAGTQASYSHSGFSGGSLGDATKAKFVKKAHKFEVGTGDDAECLIISEVANTDTTYYTDAVTAQGTFTAAEYGTDSFTANTLPSIDTTKFSGGAKAADTFVANELQDVATGTVHDTPSAALAEAPTFTGDKFRVATSTDTVLKDVEFAGTAAAVKLTGAKYLKQEIDTKTFTPVAAELGFAGTEVADFQVTGVKYDKATANGATFAGTAATLSTTFSGTAATITVTPDAE